MNELIERIINDARDRQTNVDGRDVPYDEWCDTLRDLMGDGYTIPIRAVAYETDHQYEITTLYITEREGQYVDEAVHDYDHEYNLSLLTKLSADPTTRKLMYGDW